MPIILSENLQIYISIERDLRSLELRYLGLLQD